MESFGVVLRLATPKSSFLSQSPNEEGIVIIPAFTNKAAEAQKG